eukprot:COSAG02_NODE_652_length_18867_cov_30.656756_18_plen_87_part_00
MLHTMVHNNYECGTNDLTNSCGVQVDCLNQAAVATVASIGVLWSRHVVTAQLTALTRQWNLCTAASSHVMQDHSGSAACPARQYLA